MIFGDVKILGICDALVRTPSNVGRLFVMRVVPTTTAVETLVWRPKLAEERALLHSREDKPTFWVRGVDVISNGYVLEVDIRKHKALCWFVPTG